MPELPEVESIKIQLQKYLVGHKIKSIDIKSRKTFQGSEKEVIEARVKGIRRFAKVTCIDLSNGYSILIHVKLTGQIIYRGPNLKKSISLSKKVVGGIPGPHTLVIFNLDRGGFLYYNDVRRFGWIRIIKTSEVANEPFIKKLGPEPFGLPQGKPSLLTKELFEQILSKSKRPVKVVLMDQEKIGGVGNIYANDALWKAKINPKKPANKLSGLEVNELYLDLLEVLRKGMKYGGASELAFVTPDGAEGEYQKHTLAYGHDGETCPRHPKVKFEKYFLGGRGTYVCPVCQK